MDISFDFCCEFEIAWQLQKKPEVLYYLYSFIEDRSPFQPIVYFEVVKVIMNCTASLR